MKELNLSNRTLNVLKAEGIEKVGDLVVMSEEELFRTPNIGRRSLNEIILELKRMGLCFGMILPGSETENQNIEVSRPLKHRPDVIVFTGSDGMKRVIGDGKTLTNEEYLKVREDLAIKHALKEGSLHVDLRDINALMEVVDVILNEAKKSIENGCDCQLR